MARVGGPAPGSRGTAVRQPSRCVGANGTHLPRGSHSIHLQTPGCRGSHSRERGGPFDFYSPRQHEQMAESCRLVNETEQSLECRGASVQGGLGPAPAVRRRTGLPFWALEARSGEEDPGRWALRGRGCAGRGRLSRPWLSVRPALPPALRGSSPSCCVRA